MKCNKCGTILEINIRMVYKTQLFCPNVDCDNWEAVWVATNWRKL